MDSEKFPMISWNQFCQANKIDVGFLINDAGKTFGFNVDTALIVDKEGNLVVCGDLFTLLGAIKSHVMNLLDESDNNR